MASVWMMSFDWDGLNEVLARRPAELAARLAERLRRKYVPYGTAANVPHDKSELVDFLRSLLSAEDWYAGRSPREARAIDGVMDDFFDHQEPLEPLKLKPLRDGVMLEMLEVAKGTLEIDHSRNTPRSRQLHFKKPESPPEANVPELADLGSRPFRHPAWDRRAAEELLTQNNPFIHGPGAEYDIPEYSIHSPEQVLTLRQELARVGGRVRRELDRVPSKRVRDDVIANFERDRVGAIEEAANSGRAVYARQDH